MSTYTNVLSGDLSTDANARALWGWIDGKLQADGWSYVAQTGDADPNTMTTGANGTYPVFRVYSTTVGSETWYMRLDYGHVANGPSLKVKWGSGVDGSGTLTGQIGAQTTPVPGASMAASGKTFQISIAAGRFMFYANIFTATTASWAIACHMEVDSSGALTTGLLTGVFHTTASAAPVIVFQTIPASGDVPLVSSGMPVITDSLATKVIGAKTKTFFVTTWYATVTNNPNPFLTVCGITDHAAGANPTASLYSSSRTFAATGMVNPHSGTSGGNLNNRLCFLWE